MRFAKLVAVVALLAAAGSAFAQDHAGPGRRRSRGGIVLRDTIAGALVGSAAAGGVIFYEMGIEENDEYDWGRALAWGAAAGLCAGLVWGAVDAAIAAPERAATTRRSPVRDGLSMSLDVRRKDQSRRELFPVLTARF